MLCTLSLLLTLVTSGLAKEEPLPDTSEGCNLCKQTIDDLQFKWTNQSSIDSMVADLIAECDAKYSKNPVRRQICSDLSAELIKIPAGIAAGIFGGIESLAWPVSLGLCATANRCHVNCCVAHAPPEQIHLSLASTDRSIMGVSWVTLEGSISQVKYGTSATNLNVLSEGTVLTNTKAGWVGQIHRAIMHDLAPATTYYYQVGADDASGWSEVYSFTTFAPHRAINYAVIADMAYDVNSDNTVLQLTKLVDAGQLDVVIHSGDISYADGYMPHFDDFMNKIQPIAARVPYQVTPGNHEFGYNFTVYKQRFFMPGQIDEGGSGDGMYYAWEYGRMHFAALSSESAIDTPMFSRTEKVWANKELLTVNRAKTPWSIAHIHRPLYCAKDAECGQLLRHQGLEDVLYNNKVDLVLVGHDHTYERSAAVYNNTRMEDGTAPVYLMQGASGNREGK